MNLLMFPKGEKYKAAKVKLPNLNHSKNDKENINLKKHAESNEVEKEKIKQDLIQSFSKVLYIPTDQINPDLPFNEMGLDSILGVEWIKEVNQLYSTNFTATKIFEFPTILKMSEYIYNLIGNKLIEQKISDVPSLIDKTIYDNNLLKLFKENYLYKTYNRIYNYSELSAPQSLKIAIIGMSGKFPKQNIRYFLGKFKVRAGLYFGSPCISMGS